MNTITLQSEYVFNAFGLSITNTFFTTLLVTVFLSLLAFWYSSTQKKKQPFLLVAVEVIVYQILKTIDQFTQNRVISKQLLPLIATFFLFIFFANILALLPGFLGTLYIFNGIRNVSLLRSPNSDLSTTLALAIISLVATQYFSIRMNGFGAHFSKYFNFKTPLTFFIGFIELISEGAKLLSFSLRLFGNIFAGEVLLLISAFLIPYILPIPFMILELFVGLIQSYIFALLTLSFIKTNMRSNTLSVHT